MTNINESSIKPRHDLVDLAEVNVTDLKALIAFFFLKFDKNLVFQ